MVDTVFNNAIDSLSDEDKKLPQVWHFYCLSSGIFSILLCCLELYHVLSIE